MRRVFATAGVISVFALAAWTPTLAQLQPTGPGGPISSGARWGYALIARNLLESAEKMAEADYGFKPVDSVRTFGQLVGHVANAQYLFCAAVKGEPNPNQGQNAEKLATKTESVAALKKAVSYCDQVYASVTDENAGRLVKLFGTEMSAVTALYGNVAHAFEHYGNMVTYMRMKGLVPPSTERAQQSSPSR
jgi:uncharacterized damage-inducible protein DinB